MKYEALLDFIQNKMRMSHIYQPFLIKTLIEAGGSATVRQLAHSLLSQDESQIIYYEKRIKEMPVRVLRNHDIISTDKDFVTLNVKGLTFTQKAEIKMVCEQKMQEFLVKRGLGTWDYRMIDNPVPDSLRYIVLRDGGGRCALCGATKKERPLDVDHIVPKSKGGKTSYDNLQVLCAKCNRSKGNKDRTDFRIDPNEQDEKCLFCNGRMGKHTVMELPSCYAAKDAYPVTDGHLLVIPKRHVSDYFDLSRQERDDMDDMIRVMRSKIQSKDTTVTGINIGVNIGESAGQSIFHAHVHLIPRRDGDTDDPKGGVRGVIPGKRGY
jgi:ATP adenylyltransferase